MQEFLQGVKNKTIIDAELKQLLPLLNLDAKGEDQPMNRSRYHRNDGRASALGAG